MTGPSNYLVNEEIKCQFNIIR